MSKGNLAEEMGGMIPGYAASSALKVIYQTENGVVLGICSLTAFTALTVGADAGTYIFAPNCLIMSINSVAVNSVRLVWNTGTSTAPVFTGLVS